MATKKDYINLIRWSCIVDSFNSHYFIRIIVLYLLAQNVTPWVAVSIPIVSIPVEDVMESIDESKPLNKKSKNNTILVTSLFVIFAGFWCKRP